MTKLRPCDHSNGDRVAVVGSSHIDNIDNEHDLLTIPVIDILYPSGVPFNLSNPGTHDFAIMVLEQPVSWSRTVQQICLPTPGEEFSHQEAFAAGWGRTSKQPKRTSKDLMFVDLKVGSHQYQHDKMFGTLLTMNEVNIIKDACEGDSGGPLFLFKQKTPVLIGKLQIVTVTIQILLNLILILNIKRKTKSNPMDKSSSV